MRKRELKEKNRSLVDQLMAKTRLANALQRSLDHEISRRLRTEDAARELRGRVDKQTATISKMQDERRETLEDHAELAAERSEAWRQLRLIRTAMRAMTLEDFDEHDAERDAAIREIAGVGPEAFGVVVLESH